MKHIWGILGLTVAFFFLKLIASGFPENLIQWIIIPIGSAIVWGLILIYDYLEAKSKKIKEAKKSQEKENK